MNEKISMNITEHTEIKYADTIGNRPLNTSVTVISVRSTEIFRSSSEGLVKLRIMRRRRRYKPSLINNLP